MSKVKDKSGQMADAIATGVCAIVTAVAVILAA
jgi:hypothetical protein